MRLPDPDIALDVDLRNPGQFFACCGALELAGRLWPGSEENGWRDPEGWFEAARSRFCICSSDSRVDLVQMVGHLRGCNISGLTDGEVKERENLELRKRKLKKTGAQLPPEMEQRRKELGNKARKGTLRIGGPFHIDLDWWQAEDDDSSPKTWAGLQEMGKVTSAAQAALPTTNGALFQYYCPLRMDEGRGKAVESFYFDARRLPHGRDVGYSLDVLEADTVSYPAVELLALIGLQRFRPLSPSRGVFVYRAWSSPMPASIAAAASVLPTAGGLYRFAFRHRDDQQRYKAFDFATLLGGSP